MSSSKPPRPPRRFSAIFRESVSHPIPQERNSDGSGAPTPAFEREIRGDPVAEMDRLLTEAVRAGASDLHLDPFSGGIAVRHRIDGLLEPVAMVPESMRAALISRVKVMAGMDIAVKRRPQDGGFGIRKGSLTLAVRVSTLPVEGGEKTVLRILDPSRLPRTLEAVGLLPEDLARVRGLVGGAHGAVLVVGPTGSGKSSTLFGTLAEMDRQTRNIVTLEDPIETRVEGVNQVQVSPRAGLTFPAALRAVLRQDPDVIMVGEIRDTETAEIAMASAMTGHLVLSSLHSTDAPSAVVRLLQMGVAPYLVAGGLRAVIAQRLVRRCCNACGGPGGGCAECRSGYRGRLGVFEILEIDDVLKEEIVLNRGLSSMRRHLQERGHATLEADARTKIARGWTTHEEVTRVVGPIPDTIPSGVP
jgi:type II secretory ATPase GspE/PulE/Tfp pilus assembly ATPase PilB-like protein